MAPGTRLARIVEAISDGSPVDWEQAAAGLDDPVDRARLAQLRVLQEVAHFHAAGGDEPTHSLATGAPVVTGPTRWAGLEVRGLIGSGGFGRVYEAWDPNLEREVALKLVETSRFQNLDAGGFLREGRLLARVRHPNVAQVHGADVSGGFAGLWMERIRGETLEAALREKGPFGAGEAARIGIEVCRGLAAVHAAGLVHRDVKAANVMRERGGRIVLMDLGAGYDAAAEAPGDGGITGTPFYMAPECLAGETATPAADVYSLGVLLFRLTSARFPIEAGTLEKLRDAHRAGRRRSLRDLRPDLPPEFIQVVDRATALRPGDRYGSAGQMQEALERLGGGQVSAPEAPAPGSTAQRTRPLAALTRPRLALAAILVIGGAVAAGVLWTRRTAPGTARVDATFYRSTDSVREPLRDGDPIHAGDRLSITVDVPATTYVYVLNQDDSGAIFLLFPLSGLVPGNPLPPGTGQRLPGTLDGRPQAWVASRHGGTERFLVVSSRQPLGEIEADLAALPRPSIESGLLYARLSADSERRLRSLSGLAEDAEVPAGGLFERLEQMGSVDRSEAGVTIRHLRLRND